MRKVAFAGLAILISSAAHAQTNEAFIEQIGLGNTVVVDQTNDGNSVGRLDQRIFQDNDVVGTVGNSATITQDGADQVGVGGLGLQQRGESNTITVTQGAAATAANPGMRADTLIQAGQGNSITIDQDGDNEGVDAVIQDNRAFAASDQDNNGPDFVLGNTVEITQIGSGNGAAPAVTEIRQFGWQNFGSIVQAGIDGGFAITQEGDANLITVTQFGTAELAVVDSFTLGNENDLDIQQDGVRPDVTADIVGSFNEFDIRQSGGTTGNDVNLNVVGNSNGFGPGFTVGGPADTVLDEILLSGSLGIGGITQEGENNRVDLAIGSSGFDSNDNLLSIAQRGDDNALSLTIQGDANQSGILQQGNANVVGSGQFGDGNNLGIRQ